MSRFNHAIGGLHICSLDISWGKDWLINLGQSVPSLLLPLLPQRISNGAPVLVLLVGADSSKEQANPAILGLTHH